MRTLVIHPKDKTTDFLKPIYWGRDDWTVITGGTRDEVDAAIAEHDHIIMMGHGTPQGLLSMGQFDRKPFASKKPSTVIRKDGPVTPSKIKEFYGKGAEVSSQKSLLESLPAGVRGYDDRGKKTIDTDEDWLDDDWYSSRQVGAYSGGYTGWSSSALTSSYIIDDKSADLLRGKRLTAIWCNADQYMEWNNLSGFYTGMFISDTSEASMIGTSDTEQWQVDESNYAFATAMRGLVDKQNPHEVLNELRRRYNQLAKRNAVAKYNMLRLFARQAIKAEAANAS